MRPFIMNTGDAVVPRWQEGRVCVVRSGSVKVRHTLGKCGGASYAREVEVRHTLGRWKCGSRCSLSEVIGGGRRRAPGARGMTCIFAVRQI